MFLPMLFWLVADGTDVPARAAPATPPPAAVRPADAALANREPANRSPTNNALAGTAKPVPPSLELLEFIGRGLDRLPSLAPPAADARTAEAGQPDIAHPTRNDLPRGSNPLGNTSPSGAAPCVPTSCVH